MPGVHRQGDPTTGHPCWPPTTAANFSADVMINNKGAVRSGDKIVTHCCTPGCHDGTYIGSSKVMANGQSLILVGDPVSCGDTADGGSPDVICG